MKKCACSYLSKGLADKNTITKSLMKQHQNRDYWPTSTSDCRPMFVAAEAGPVWLANWARLSTGQKAAAAESFPTSFIEGIVQLVRTLGLRSRYRWRF